MHTVPFTYSLPLFHILNLANIFTRRMKTTGIGVGSGGARGVTRPPPPSFKLGGHRPPPTLPTVYIMNFIAVLNGGTVPQENHIFVV